MKLYIGCALTQAPEAFRGAIDALKNDVRKEGHEVFNFLGLVNGTSQDVYQHDIHNCVADCDAFVAIVDYPSTGLGYELATAVEKLQKPTLALAHADSLVTRLVLGVNQPHYMFMRYQSLEEIPKMVNNFLRCLK